MDSQYLKMELPYLPSTLREDFVEMHRLSPSNEAHSTTLSLQPSKAESDTFPLMDLVSPRQHKAQDSISTQLTQPQPAELRTEIYEKALDSNLITMGILRGPKCPPLLLTNHQVRNEAGHNSFEKSTFVFFNEEMEARNLALFRKRAGESVNHIRKARIFKLKTVFIRQISARFEIHHDGKMLEIVVRPGLGCEGPSKDASNYDGTALNGKGAYVCGDSTKPCYCRLRKLATTFGKQPDSVLRFLEAWTELDEDVAEL